MEASVARQTSEPDDQDGLFDDVIENDVLTAALERRHKANEAKKSAVRKFKEADDAAKGQIAALDLGDGTTVRCGRFRIRKFVVKGRSVAFDTGESSRLSISPLGD